MTGSSWDLWPQTSSQFTTQIVYVGPYRSGKTIRVSEEFRPRNDVDRAMAEFSAAIERIRNQQCHRPPPVTIELACLAERERLVTSQRPRVTPWSVSRQSRPRERRSRRRRIRVWEREL